MHRPKTERAPLLSERGSAQSAWPEAARGLEALKVDAAEEVVGSGRRDGRRRGGRRAGVDHLQHPVVRGDGRLREGTGRPPMRAGNRTATISLWSAERHEGSNGPASR